jgi:hypothetical protein
MKSKDRQITREELYKLVWSKPLTVLAKEFGMSDVGLANVCKKLNVPKPYRGYWQLVEAGRKLPIPPLPPAREGDPTRATLSPEYYRVNFKPQDPKVLNRIDGESLPENRITVAENLDNPHRLVRNTKILLRKGKPDECGRLHCWEINENRPRLRVRVSKNALPRALLIMDALIKALEARGCKVEAEGRTVCHVGETEVAFYLWETVRRSERVPTEKQKEESWRYDRWQYTPTGELVFTLDEFWAERKNWRDGKKKKLEDKLNDIVAGMFAAAEKLRLREIEQREEEQRRVEAEHQREEMERQLKMQEERRNQLDAMVATWLKSTNLRQFLQECERSLSLNAKSPDPAGAYWLSWAQAYADALDPIKNGSLQEMMGWA